MPRKPQIPVPPKGSGPSGQRLWRSVVDVYTLEEHEQALLKEACRCADLLDQLAAVIAKEGPTVNGRMNPAVRESREQKIASARLISALRLPAGPENEQAAGRRPQRCSGARGVYQFPGVS